MGDLAPLMRHDSGWTHDVSGPPENPVHELITDGVSLRLFRQGRRVVAEIGIAKPLTPADELGHHHRLISLLSLITQRFPGVGFLVKACYDYHSATQH